MNYQDELREKIQEYITTEGVTRTHICRVLSMSNGAFTMFMKGERNLGEDKEKLLKDFLAEKTKD